jgi:hypothetical protein
LEGTGGYLRPPFGIVGYSFIVISRIPGDEVQIIILLLMSIPQSLTERNPSWKIIMDKVQQ